MPHTHVIDGKVLTFDDTTCGICHPELAKPQEQKEAEVLPRVYRKGSTLVLKISRVTMVTLNYVPKITAYLLSIQRMMRDGTGKVILGQDSKPMWTNITIRLNNKILKDWITQTSQLLTEIENQQTVPNRN